MNPSEININEDPTEKLGQVFKLLSHPLRLSILEHLRQGEQCVCHLEAYLGVRQAALSQQLSLLRNAGLIQDRRDGWNVFYRVAEPSVFSLLDSALTFAGLQAQQNKEAKKPCPCPKCNNSKNGSIEEKNEKY